MLQNRNDNWANICQPGQQWDLVVVGGGITGAGIAQTAARRGLKVLLVEQRDFAWGTSSRSSKMVHGGLRYLAQGDFSLTRESLTEREFLLGALPGLIERMSYYYVLGPKAPPRFAVKLLLRLYDWLAGITNHWHVPANQLGLEMPGFNRLIHSGAYHYTDAITDDSRLVQRMIAEAQHLGAVCINYCKAEQLLKHDGRVCGVQLVNKVSLQTAEVHALAVVNATGAWADRLRNEVNLERRVRPQRGSHILVSQKRLRVTGALTLMHPLDGRYHFIYPWAGKTVIGTTDLDHSEDLDIEAHITEQEVDYLLMAANTAFPGARLMREDIISTWSGVRPIIGSEKSKDPSKERRDHAVWSDQGLITVSGGKLTTFRVIAEDVLNAVAESLPGTQSGRFTRKPEVPFVRATSVTPMTLLEQGCELACEYLARYGDAASDIVQQSHAQGRADELIPISDTRYSFADCRWALRHEQVQHLDDLMLRRTTLGLLLPNGGEAIMEPVRELCIEELGWSDSQWHTEYARYTEIYRRYYSLPVAIQAQKSPSAAASA
ncbi:glycerol-3-phosphate dehydrogenase/oxidase [Simiduia sp. 21SJ11W-1]|uniref:glycerol-3-phosphate dehydrogenase/oxidase n=1 Tax=Simiduia sp. 21SJ11W-1 TaxID=2909669 RepID=UPI00209F9F13|nr:glycerol-3-phosphate dehydrogenase/oxidase [Simiduia sp. 21SJ11W-1]UTA46471.1 glycerol-3-phosphate dehydrogenase/oxidase [Simiduia sp. 21SJ11W-1]